MIYIRKILESKFKHPPVDTWYVANGKQYFVYSTDGDDSFYPAIARYEILQGGYVWFETREGIVGLITGTDKEIETWMNNVDKQLIRQPLVRPWKPEDGGKKYLDIIRNEITKLSHRFKVSVPDITFIVGSNNKVGSHGDGHITLFNSHYYSTNTDINFPIKTFDSLKVAVHEFSHYLFTKYTSQGHNALNSLKKISKKISSYHQIAGELEGFCDLMAAYILDPEGLQKYSKELYQVALDFEMGIQ